MNLTKPEEEVLQRLISERVSKERIEKADKAFHDKALGLLDQVAVKHNGVVSNCYWKMGLRYREAFFSTGIRTSWSAVSTGSEHRSNEYIEYMGFPAFVDIFTPTWDCVLCSIHTGELGRVSITKEEQQA